jgi:hypothetical protein
MKKLRVYRCHACLVAIVFVFLCAGGVPVQGQSVTWPILPFPSADSDWTGPFGQPATTNGGLLTLQGQPLRTVQSFSCPLHISYDVVLPARTTSDGGLQLNFIPTGLASNKVSPNLLLYLVYRNYAPGDSMQILSNGAAVLWENGISSIVTQTVYHVSVDVSASGGLIWAVNNLTNSIPNTVLVPFNPFQLELEGWQPQDVWKVSNFSVVPEPATVTLVGVGLMSIGIVIRRRRSVRG